MNPKLTVALRSFAARNSRYCFLFPVLLLLALSVSGQPVIQSLSPASGPVGTTVTIRGTGLGTSPGAVAVYFGAARATVLQASPAALKVTVPTGATHDPLTVTVGGLTAYTKQPFGVTAPPPYNGWVDAAFARAQDTYVGNYPNFITAGDVDGDGKPDVIVLNQDDNTASVFRNTGTPGTISWAPAVNYAAGTHPFSADLGDLNGDGKPDLVIGDYDSSRIVIYKNSGAPGTVSFTEKMLLPIALHFNPISVGIADFDGDGKSDIAAVNNNGYSVSLFRNISSSDTLRFEAKKDFPVGDWPQRLTINDFNGDGKPDLAVPNFNANTVSLLQNNSSAGVISFAAKADLPTGTAPFQATSCDLNGDGQPELVVANSQSSSFSVFRNTTSGGVITFAPKTDIPLPFTTLYAAPHDLDGDGKVDLAFITQGAGLSLFRNTSTPEAISFAPRLERATGSMPRTVFIGDLNEDGQPDIAHVNSLSYTFSVHTNVLRAVPLIRSFSPATGSVDSVITITGSGLSGATAVEIGSVPVASFTATATSIRAVVAGGATGDVVVITPQGNAVARGFTFQAPAPQVRSFAPASGATGSTVTIQGKYFLYGGSSPLVYFGAVKATVTAATDTTLAVVVPPGASHQPLTVTVNGRTAYAGAPFVVTFPSSGNGFKPRSVAPRQVFASGSNPRRVVAADFDGDGRPDLLVTNQAAATASVFHNTGTRRKIALATPLTLASAAEPFDGVSADFDGDGRLDVALTQFNGGNAGSVAVRRNIGTAGSIAFASPLTMEAGNGPQGIAAGDLDGDGRPDLVVTAGNSGSLLVYKNTSTDTGRIAFAAPVSLSALRQSTAVVLADLDGDGRPEVVTADFSGAAVTVRHNDSRAGNLFFGVPASFPAGSQPAGLCAADVDGDGKTDIAVVNYGSNTLSVLRNNSSAATVSFDAKVDYPTGEAPRAVAAGDLDGDGRADLVVTANTPSAVSVWRSTGRPGTVAFAEPLAYPTGMQPPALSLADMDGDSKPDILVGDDFSSLSILRNRLDEPIILSFTPAAAETDSSVTIRGENFSTTSAVHFGAVSAGAFSIASDSVILARVGTGATGAVKVRSLYGEDTLSGFTYIPPTPDVLAFAPQSGTVGTEVRIQGRHLGSVQVVRFGGQAATAITHRGDTLITAVVGKGASGAVTVSGPNGSDTVQAFRFIAPLPELLSFSPTTGSEGTLVTLKGRNLTWTTGVSLGGTPAVPFSVISDSVLTARVGSGGTGIVRVDTEFGSDTLGGFIFLLEDALLAYPNPGSSYTVVAHEAVESPAQLTLVDANGRVIKTVAVAPNESQTRLELRNLQPGIYRVTWSDGKRSVSHTLLVQ